MAWTFLYMLCNCMPNKTAQPKVENSAQTTFGFSPVSFRAPRPHVWSNSATCLRVEPLEKQMEEAGRLYHGFVCRSKSGVMIVDSSKSGIRFRNKDLVSILSNFFSSSLTLLLNKLECLWTHSFMARLGEDHETSGLYYKHMTIVNYTSSVVNKLWALLTDDARVIIYDHRVFILQATGVFPLSRDH
jgi:hypothetical protein